MAIEIENSIKKAAAKVAEYVEDIATMTVETYYVEVVSERKTNMDEAKLAASSVIKIDGDSKSILPLRKGENDVMEVDMQVYALHQQNVQVAIDYRSRMMAALLDTLQPQRRR